MSNRSWNPDNMSVVDDALAVNVDQPAMAVGSWPGIASLLLGESFLHNDLQTDLITLLHEAGRIFGDSVMAEAAVPGLLKQLEVGNTSSMNLLLLSVLFGRIGSAASVDARAARRFVERCHFYCAVSGHPASGRKVAGHAIEIAYARELPEPLVVPHMIAAVAWLNVATGKWRAPEGWTTQVAASFLGAVVTPDGIGSRMVERMLFSRQQLLRGASANCPPSVVSPTRSLFSSQAISVSLGMGLSGRRRHRTLH